MTATGESRLSTDDIYKRLSAVEQDTASLTTNVKSLISSVDNLSKEVRARDRPNFGICGNGLS